MVWSPGICWSVARGTTWTAAAPGNDGAWAASSTSTHHATRTQGRACARMDRCKRSKAAWYNVLGTGRDGRLRAAPTPTILGTTTCAPENGHLGTLSE